MVPRTVGEEGEAFLPIPGGAIFNTAIALGRLGEPTGFVSGISNDMFGDQLQAALKASSVDASLCHRSSQPTTLAFVKLTDGNAEYSFFDENSAGQLYSVADIPEFSPNTEALHFGAISLIPEPCGSAYEEIIARKSKDCVISLDPNIRPSFIKDHDSHRARLERLILNTDILKVSDEDLAWIAGPRSQLALIRTWLENGTSIVLVTKGADGVVAHTSSGTVSRGAVKAVVVDTIGAGDTFNAGFLAGLRRVGSLKKQALKQLRPENLLSALDLATNVAAVTVARAGANPPWDNEL